MSKIVCFLDCHISYFRLKGEYFVYKWPLRNTEILIPIRNGTNDTIDFEKRVFIKANEHIFDITYERFDGLTGFKPKKINLNLDRKTKDECGSKFATFERVQIF